MLYMYIRIIIGHLLTLKIRWKEWEIETKSYSEELRENRSWWESKSYGGRDISELKIGYGCDITWKYLDYHSYDVSLDDD